MGNDQGNDENHQGGEVDDGKALPTYQDLAAREGGPNSSAAERYADDPQRRRQSTGWGPTVEVPEVPQPPAYSVPSEELPARAPAPPPVTRAIARCLSVAHFGSRFIPHSHIPIETLLPLGLDDRFVLLGTQRGLTVLDILPSLHGAQPVAGTARALEEAKPHDVWTGEGVWQLALLETQDIGGPSPQGTVLALVGAEVNENTIDRKGMEPVRTIRMYNLASLTSLVKWCVTKKDAHPVDLRRPASSNPAQPSAALKKHRPASSSVFSNFKALFIDPQSPPSHIQPYDLSAASTPITPTAQTPRLALPPSHSRSVSPSARPSLSAAPPLDTPGDWDIIEDLPLRWATDYTQRTRRTSLNDPSRGQPQLALFVTFAKKAGLIRLGDAAVGEVELWDEESSPSGSMSVGVGRRSTESLPNVGFGVERGEGGWAPLETCNVPPQAAQDEPREAQSPSTAGPASPYPTSSIGSPISTNPSAVPWSTAPSSYPLLNSSASHPRINTKASRYSSSPSPGPFTALPLPAPSSSAPPSAFASGPLYPAQIALLTRGRRTDVVALPLRVPVGSRAPLCTVMWMTPPSKLASRVVTPASNTCGPNEPVEARGSYLQIVAFLKEGVDVAEIPLSTLRLDKPASWAKGKGKASTGLTEEVRLVKVDVGGPAGYLAPGGRWHRFGNPGSEENNGGAAAKPGRQGGRFGVQRADSAWSVSSWDSSIQEHQREMEKQRKAEEGCYAWVCRGHGVRVSFA
ncbi:hypothetical protein FRC10_005118 [Ceratobasidium sp. 414]|nr:hypothetical protein FRC10_005118 [Ceratobasidium sp. 414]